MHESISFLLNKKSANQLFHITCKPHQQTASFTRVLSRRKTDNEQERYAASQKQILQLNDLTIHQSIKYAIKFSFLKKKTNFANKSI